MALGVAEAVASVVPVGLPVALPVGLAEPSGRFCSVAADPQAVRRNMPPRVRAARRVRVVVWVLCLLEGIF